MIFGKGGSHVEFVERTGVLFVVVALLAARLPFLFQTPDVQLSLLSDDAFYYLGAARRVAETGHWPSMDGLHPTNGFHPLYMFFLVAIQKLAGTEPGRVLPIVLGFNLALNGLAAWIAARRMDLGRKGAAAAAAAVFLALSPGWMAHGLAGVENSLSALLLLLVALRWRSRLRGGTTAGAPRVRGWLVDGVLCGLAILGRTDAIVVVAAFIAMAFVVRLRAEGSRTAIAELVVTGLAATLLVAPWFALSLWFFGTVQQDSAASLAYRFYRIAGHIGSAKWFAQGTLSLGFWIYRLAWAWGLIPLTGWLVGLGVPWDRWRRAAKEHIAVDRAVPWLVVGLCAVAMLVRGNDVLYINNNRGAALELALGLTALLLGILSPRTSPRRDDSWWWLLAGSMGLLALIYSTVLQAFQVWYTTAATLLAVLLLTLPTLAGLIRARPRVALVLAVMVALQCLLHVSSYLEHGARERLFRTALSDGLALRHKLEAAVVDSGGRMGFGSFDSGKLSYLVHPFPVENLDGVMSHGASVALRGGHLADFMKREGITHLIATKQRIAEFQRVNSFEVSPDSVLTARLGQSVYAVVR